MNSTSRTGLRVPTGQRQINQDTMKSIGFTTQTNKLRRKKEELEL